jgi:hypothetical protein
MRLGCQMAKETQCAKPIKLIPDATLRHYFQHQSYVIAFEKGYLSELLTNFTFVIPSGIA